MKVPEAVLKAYSDSLRETAVDSNQPGPDPVKALEAALEQLREELEGREARAIAGEAACRDREGEDAVWVPESVHAMSWEGNAAAGTEAALNSVLGDKEEGR